MNLSGSPNSGEKLFNFGVPSSNFPSSHTFSEHSSTRFNPNSYRPPEISLDKIAEQLKDEFKENIKFSSLGALVQESWDDVPRNLLAAMRAGILLAKKEALIAELERREAEKIRIATENEKVKRELEKQLLEAEKEKKRQEALKAQKLEKEKEKEKEKKKAEAKKAEAASKTSQATSKSSTTPSQSTSLSPSWAFQKPWEEAVLLRKELLLLKKLIPMIESQAHFKKERLEIRKKIRPKFGQIVNSKSKVKEIITYIDTILTGLMRNSKPLYYWALNFMSKQALKQAETEFSINPSTSFPLARTLIGLMQRHQLFKKFFMVRVYKKCPISIPGSLPSFTKLLPEDEYRKRLGYIRNDGQWETNESYINRQGGMFSLYCAFLQYDETDDELNSFGPKDAWIWIQRFLSAPIIPCSSKILTQFLQNCGFKLQNVYGTQFIKILRLIRVHYIPKLDAETHAHNVRLELCIDGYFNSNYLFEAPKGRNYPPGDGGVFVRTPFKSQLGQQSQNNPPQNNPSEREPDNSNHDQNDSDDDWGSFL